MKHNSFSAVLNAFSKNQTVALLQEHRLAMDCKAFSKKWIIQIDTISK